MDEFIVSSTWLLFEVNTLVVIFAAVSYAIYSNCRRKKSNGVRVLAFFHPYCDSGGGGERVLWMMIHALLKEDQFKDNLKIVIYAAKGDKDKEHILSAVKDSFRIDLTEHSDRILFVSVSTTALLEAKWYPVATMLFQSLASILVGLECLIRCTPDIYCDTMGAAFTYPLAKLLCGCTVVTYTHYPIISSDMLQRVREQRPAHNNDGIISGSVSISAAKLGYYQLFAIAYTIVGSFADKVMVNSSWTESHISQLWRLQIDPKKGPLQHNTDQDPSRYEKKQTGGQGYRKSLVKLYPPCNTTHLQGIPLGHQESRKRLVLSIGQFRPEKDHLLQLK